MLIHMPMLTGQPTLTQKGAGYLYNLAFLS